LISSTCLCIRRHNPSPSLPLTFDASWSCTGINQKCHPQPVAPIVLSRASFAYLDVVNLLVVAVSTISPTPSIRLVDTRAAVNLISPDMSHLPGVRIERLPASQPVILADGSHTSFHVTHCASLTIRLPPVCRTYPISALVCPNGSTDMILGLPWIRAKSSNIDWSVPRFVHTVYHGAPSPIGMTESLLPRVSAVHPADLTNSRR